MKKENKGIILGGNIDDRELLIGKTLAQIKAGSDELKIAMPLYRLIVITFGMLSFACIAGGIIAILWNSSSKTEFEILGSHLTTEHVGVAFVGIGLIIAYFTVMALLRNLREIAELPENPHK